MNGLAGCYVSTIGKPHEYFDLTRDGRTAPTLAQSTLDRFFANHKRRELALENVALRQQLAVLRRSVKRPRLSKVDREFWVLLRRIWTDWDERNNDRDHRPLEWHSLCPSPATLHGEARARPSQATNESSTHDSGRRICVGFACRTSHQLTPLRLSRADAGF